MDSEAYYNQFLGEECDNVSACHDLTIIVDAEDGMRVICKDCKHQYVIPKDTRGVVDNRIYSKIFRKEILQPSDNLFFKYYKMPQN
jgi:hypothetical protein